MPSQYSEEHECPKCYTKVYFTIKTGIYPFRDCETGDCPVCGYEIFHKNILEALPVACVDPVCGYEIFHKNITGDIEADVVSIENTVEPYLSEYKNSLS